MKRGGSSNILPMERITQSGLEEGIAWLINREPRFRAIVDQFGLPPLRLTEPGLEGLLRTITDQLISLQAAAAIWTRISLSIPAMTAESLLAFNEPTLRAMGLSGAKARSFMGIADAVSRGNLDFSALSTMPDMLARSTLMSLPGVGPWTADIFLLSALGRPDAWPAGDLALQVAAQNLFGGAHRPDAADMMRLAEAWKPWRSVAARLLWSHYRGMKGMGQIPF